MKTLARPLRAARLLSLLQEVDLGAIKNEAERRFSLELTGDPDLTVKLAELLSETPGRSGVHPYIALQNALRSPQHPSAGTAPDLRLNVQKGVAPPSQSFPTPTLNVCVLDGDDAAKVGAELPHPGEAGRVILDALTAETLQSVLIPQILRTVAPTLRLALGKQLPAFRPAVIRGLIEEASRANALYAVSTGVAEIVPVLNLPLNVADTVVLTKNQLVMAYKVALAAGKTGRPQELVGELIGVLGGGLLFRQVARGLIGLIPVWGIVPKVAVAYAGTQVIGTAASLWATQGKTVSATEVHELYAGALTRGRNVAEQLLPTRFKRSRAVLEPEKISGELEPPLSEENEQSK